MAHPGGVPEFRYEQFCPLARAAEVLGERWTLLVIRELVCGEQRFSDLQRRLPGVSSSVLAERLTRLEAQGLVAREHRGPPTPAVLYRLTAEGDRLRPALRELMRFGVRRLDLARMHEHLEPEWVPVAMEAFAKEGPVPKRTVQVELEHEGRRASVRVTGGRSGTRLDRTAAASEATVRATPIAMLSLLSGLVSPGEALENGSIRVDGDATAVTELPSLFDLRDVMTRPGPNLKGNPMSAKPVLYGVNASPFVRKTRIALIEKGIDYDSVPQMPMGQPPEYFEISPLGKIPCYVEGDFSLPDSSAIIAYLEKKAPNPPLYPSEPQAFARALWYEEYADSKLAEMAGKVFFNRVVKAKMMKQPVDADAVAEGLAGLPPLFDYLDKEIGDRDVLAGSHFSVADIAVCSMFVNLRHAGEAVDAGRWPSLATYVERHHGRPSFKSVIEEETAVFASL